MYTYSFEKLNVWLEAKELSKLPYATTKTFPASEKFGLISQLKKAIIYICTNIAKGLVKKTNKDKADYTIMAFSSAVEVLNQLILAFKLNVIDKENYTLLRLKTKSITNKLNALRNYQINK